MSHQVRQKKTKGMLVPKKIILTYKSITGQYISVKAILKNVFQGKTVLPIAAYFFSFLFCMRAGRICVRLDNFTEL